MKHRLSLYIFFLVPSLFAARDRIIAPVDPTRTATLKGHVHPRAQAQFDDGALDPATPLSQVTLFFQPAPGIDAFLSTLQSPSSPDYRRFLSPSQFADRFGLSTGDLAKVSSWLQSQGLSIEESAQGRHWIRFNGTAGQMSKAFRTEFRRYRVNGKTHFANRIPPSVPAAFAGIVAGVQGLDDFAIRSFVSSVQPLGSLADGSHYLVPDDFAAIYNIAPLYAAGVNGAGQSIAIVGTSAIDVTDVRNFRRTFNLPPSDPQTILVGRNPGIDPVTFVEAYLDIEWAGAVARNAKIIYVYGLDVFAAAAYAVDQNVAPVLSMSFGGCELYSSPIFRGVAQQANAQGITILVASGDTGAATCDGTSPTPQASKGAQVAFPASLPEVTAIGGTSFDEGSARYWNSGNNTNGASAIGYIPEAAWNGPAPPNLLGGAGGGASALFAKPWWQASPGVPDDQARDIPDVSFTASASHDPYIIVALGSIGAVGGTSAPTPAFAGVVALLNQSLTAKNVIAQPGLGNINPTLYRLARTTTDVFHDVTTGNNAVACVQASPGCVDGAVGFNAGPGYDLATGLGSVDVARMIAQWSLGAGSTITVSADPTPISPAGTVKLTAIVKGSTFSSPTGVVTFVAQNVSDTVLGSAPLSTAGDSATAILEVPARALLASSGTVTAIYAGDTAYEASSGTVKIESASSSGSHVVAYVAPGVLTPISPPGVFPLLLALYEKTGIATRLTAFSIDDSPQPLSIFTSTAIPANGSISFSGAYTPAAPLSSSVFHFAGRDTDGSTWSEDVTVPYGESSVTRLAPAITLTSSAATVAQDPAADASCRWSHLLTLRETGGFLTQLSTLRQGNTSLSANIQRLFGTTRLAPFGTLSATVCLDSSAATGVKLYTITGVSEIGTTVTATVSVDFAGPVAAPSKLSAASRSVTITDGSPATLPLAFDTGSPAWTAVLPAKPAWLTVGNPAGTGAANIALQPKTAGLSKGAYTTLLWIQCASCVPQTLQVPVTLVIGNSSAMSIAAVAHGASFKTTFAPGMVLSAFGTQLAPATAVAGSLPLPLVLNGVSATVNGVAAPLYFVSAGQLNVQVPYEVGIGPAVLAINNNGNVATFLFQVAMVAPGIFAGDGFLAPNPSGSQGQPLLAFITGDGDQTPTLATGATPPSSTLVSRLPKPRQNVTMTIGGVPATVAFVGVPSGLAGVTQINFTVPPDAPLGDQPVVVTVGGVDSPPVKLTVKAP